MAAETEPAAGTVEPGAGCASGSRPMMSDEVRAEVLLRLRKIGGQVQGISRMVPTTSTGASPRHQRR